jgi:hypothetical protein
MVIKNVYCIFGFKLRQQRPKNQIDLLILRKHLGSRSNSIIAACYHMLSRIASYEKSSRRFFLTFTRLRWSLKVIYCEGIALFIAVRKDNA